MKKFLLVTIFTSLILVLAACGGSDNSSNGGSEGSSDSSANTVDIVASNWKFDQETYTTTAGEITFKLTADEGYHGIDIEGTDVSIDGDGSATATLEPGEYVIKCNIPCGNGHEEMHSKLVVE